MSRAAIALTCALLASQASAQAADVKPAAEHRSAPMRWAEGARRWVTGLWSKDASDWLERIGPARAEQNYQGTLVMVSGARRDTMGVFHAYDDNGRERLRLVTLAGPHREVIRDDKMVMCIGTGIDAVAYDADTNGRWNPVGQFAGAEKLDGYAAKLGAKGRVANRDCQIVDLRPSDDWRYGYRLWLDQETGLPLRIALIGENGIALEQMAFTQLQVGKAPADADLRPSTLQGLQRVQTLDASPQGDPGWRVSDPPRGFSLRSARRLGDSVQMLYSDGLAAVSVYVEPIASGQQGESAMRRGAVNVHSTWANGKRIVAIGKVPAATVDLFAHNTRAVPSAAAASR
ncbi:MAG: MucB/RseB C-terminal domain-containing protein [Pseudoxanthomonas sp.]